MARTRSDIGPRIVEAARARFLREGVDGASLRAIAADAGTSIGMVYYYFKTKDELFLAVVEDVYAGLVGDIARACAPDVPPRARVQRLYRRIGALSEREGQTVRLMLREVLVSSKRLRRVLGRFQRGHFPLVLATLADGLADGSIRADVPPLLLLLATFAVGAAPQFVMQQAGGALPLAGPRPGAALADVLVDVLWHGIGAARPAAPIPRAPRAAARSPRRGAPRSAGRGRGRG